MKTSDSDLKVNRNIYLDAVNVIGRLDASYYINCIWIYVSVNLQVTIRRFHTQMSVGRKKAFKYVKRMLPLFLAIIMFIHNIIENENSL